DLLAQQSAGGGQRHVDRGVADVLGGGGLGLGDAVLGLLLAQRDHGLEVLGGACLHALHFLTGLDQDRFGLGGGLGQRLLGLGLGFQRIGAQPLGVGDRLGD